MKEELYKIIQKDANLKYLKTYDADWIYNSLSGICKKEKMPVTIENMLAYSGTLESDLWSMFAGNDDGGEGLEYSL